jgi:precorrin-6B C5,15-methyltransferase / cobalt-precorrin-6B C5,C15-methyltransferase
MTPWLFIVGLGEDGMAGLSPAARALVESAEVLVGGARHLAMVPEDERERLTWTQPLSDLIEDIAARRGQGVCVLATGDPLDFGIGVTLARRIPIAEMTVVPAPSAFSLACARLGWPRAEVACVTLHGRPLEFLQPAIQAGARILALSNDAETPAKVAAILTARGFGASRLSVLEHMGGPKERRVEGLAQDWSEPGIADFNTLAIACVAGPNAVHLPRTPGLPDEAFQHDGLMTKREVRAVTLAALAPAPGQHLWDIGAGCGSVAIEWMRTHPRNRASAVERQAERVALMAGNAAALGVPNLDIRHGQAPEALDGLEPPDAVFLGGGLSAPGLIGRLWGALKPGGRLVANAVTLEGEQVLAGFHIQNGGEMIRIAVSRTHALGPYTGWRTFMPVTQVRAIKT